MRRFLLLAALLLGIGAAFLFWSGDRQRNDVRDSGPAAATDSVPPRRDSRVPAGATTPASGVAIGAVSATADAVADFPIAAPLNAPGGAIAQDLDIVSQLFEAWQSNFPREGNPVGENAEITVALMGGDRLELALIPKGHRAVNERGELCDRWGTPFRFHQLSGTKMEIRSAGPDRKFATDDDAVWTPQ
jgi:hypothetical protein